MVQEILINGLLYTIIANGYLFMLMISTSPRIWGVMDYNKKIRNSVTPQTKDEKRTSLLLGMPYLLFVFLYPIITTWRLKNEYAGQFTFWLAFVHLLVLLVSITLIDLIVLDLLIVSTITPKYVIVPGTTKEDYKNYREHLRGHIKSFGVQTGVFAIIAWVVTAL